MEKLQVFEKLKINILIELKGMIRFQIERIKRIKKEEV